MKRRQRTVAAVTCFALAFSGLAAAQMGMGGGGNPPGMGAPPVLRDAEGETMVMTLPNGWTPYGRSDDDKEETYLFPSGQDAADWQETLRREAYHTTAGIQAAERVYELRTENDRKSCVEFSSERLDEGPENGYSMVSWKQVCDLADGRTMASLHKTVLGNDRLYILSKIWKRDPPNRVWQRWQTYANRTYVCDPERPQHPCQPEPPRPRAR